MSATDTTPKLSSDVVEVRFQKLEALKGAGVNPYPTHFHRTIGNADLAERHKDLAPDTTSDDDVVVAGRVFSMRNSGMFVDLHDSSGKIQVFTHKDVTEPDSLATVASVETGDIIGVHGRVRRTKRGELTVDARRVDVLCKTVRPMPEKYHGIADVEQRYRKRYLDIMVNADSRTRFRQRSRILSGVRRFMEGEGFLEVETPMLHPVYGGATAEPFRTHHNSLDQDMYLRIAPELYLKRVLVGGLTEKVFEINRNFRNEGLSTRHNPEFTMMEAYWAFADYEDVMGLVERLFEGLARDLHGGPAAAFGETTIDFSGPFRRLPMPEAVKTATGIDFLSIATDAEAREAARAKGFEIEGSMTWGEVLAFLFEETTEAGLVQPTHVTHFPKDISPFAKEVAGEPRLVERFETYVNGWEICNAFSELNDPVEQRRRMVEQVEQAHARGETERVLDEDFLEAMDHGMPPAGGLGVGIDRLVMLMTDAHSIRDVVLFPALRTR